MRDRRRFDGKKADLNYAYRDWCSENGHKPLSASSLTRRLSERGFKLDPGRRNIHGIRIRPTLP